jgi:hypothetical protein
VSKGAKQDMNYKPKPSLRNTPSSGHQASVVPQPLGKGSAADEQQPKTPARGKLAPKPY